MTATSEIKERFVRWQTTTIAQLSYAINLILTFSVATLGFSITLLLNDNFNPGTWQSCIFSISLVLMLTSGAFGIGCTINRLRDFRASAKINRLCLKEPEKPNNEGIVSIKIELKILRNLTAKLGSRTWCIFWWQLGTFCAGIIFLVISAIFSIGSKLL